MAEISKGGTPSLATITPDHGSQTKGIAGEDIAAGDACYIKTSDKKIWRSTGSAVAAAAKVRGFAAMSAKTGESVTIFRNVDFHYGASLSAGADLYLSGTVAGGLADAASTGGTAPVAFVNPDGSTIHVMASRY